MDSGRELARTWRLRSRLNLLGFGAMTVRTTITYEHNAKEALQAAIQALRSAVETVPAGCDWHVRSRRALDQLEGLRSDYAGNRRADGA